MVVLALKGRRGFFGGWLLGLADVLVLVGLSRKVWV